MSFFKETISLSGDFKPSAIFLAEGAPEITIINIVLKSLPHLSEDGCVVYMIRGLSNLKSSFRLLSKEPNFEHVKKIGILVDAEDNPGGRQDQISYCLRLVDFPYNMDAVSDHVISVGDKRSGFFISPGNGQAGRIEDLVIKELETKEEWECIKQYNECINQKTAKPLDEKSIAQIGISTMGHGVCGVHHAFDKGVLDVSHATYEPIVTMINNLLA